jgi:hypothetical protein
MAISVTQALAELKLLDKRIQKALDYVTWADVKTKSHPVDTDKFSKNVHAEYQSFLALVKRRDAMKRAVVTSNATTRVKVGAWEGTVAEAIEYKTSIHYKKRLLMGLLMLWLQTMPRILEKRKKWNMIMRSLEW